MSHVTGTGFWNGFFGAFIVLVVVSVIFIPAFVLRKKEEAKETYVKWIGRIAAAFLLLVLLGMVILLINTKLHFLF